MHLLYAIYFDILIEFKSKKLVISQYYKNKSNNLMEKIWRIGEWLWYGETENFELSTANLFKGTTVQMKI